MSGRVDWAGKSRIFSVFVFVLATVAPAAFSGPSECDDLSDRTPPESAVGPFSFGDPSRFTSPCMPLPANRTPDDGNSGNDGGWLLVDFCTGGDTGCFPASPPECNRNDDDSALVNLPFFYNLYGEIYDSIYVNNNGTLTPWGAFPDSTSVDMTVAPQMIAPFWADVDTGNDEFTNLGNVWYKTFTDEGGGQTLAVTWDNVGYYNLNGDKLNTFQVLLSDGDNADMGFGNNVCFCYDDMQWTTGDASGGDGGFFGSPATVGASDGAGFSFFQYGRFDRMGFDYDGGFGGTDGVDHLDGRGAGSLNAICFSTVFENIPPEPQNFPPNDTYELSCNEEFSDFVEFASPEYEQTTFAFVTDDGGATDAGLEITEEEGNVAVIYFDWNPGPEDVGSYEVEMYAEDDAYPEPGITIASVTFNVSCDMTDTLPLPEVSEEYNENADDARAGFSLSAAGDLNRDGIDDFIAGAPGYSGGPLNAPAGAGAVFLYFGSTDPVERETADIIFVGAGEHDRLGTSVAGNFDFDNDGTNDLLFGAEEFNRTTMDSDSCEVGAACGAGRAYLVYFDPADYPNINDPNTKDFISVASVGVASAGGQEGIAGAVFFGEAFGDRAGRAVAGGGIVEDSGRPSIAVGAPGRDTNAGKSAGTAYLIFNQGLFGFYSLSDVANDGGPLEGEGGSFIDGIVYEGAGPGDELGFSVAFPGDVVEPDGEDFAMGAPKSDLILTAGGEVPALFDVGRAYVASGGNLEGGIIEVCDIGEDGEVGLQFLVDGVQIVGDQEGMQLGFTVSGGGDNLVNNEDDFMVSAPFYDYEDGTGGPEVLRTDAGLVAQTASRMDGGIIEVCEIGEDGEVDIGPVEGVRYVGAAATDRLGIGMSGLADVTGNGLGDIGMGAPFADPNGLMDAGTVYIVQGRFGGGSQALGGFEPFFEGIIEVCEIGEDTGGRQLAGDTAGEEAGTSIDGVGDFDGDGSGDFAVGSPGAEGDDGQVWLVDEGTELVPQLNSPPVADASASETLAECSGDLQAFVSLDGSLSTDPDSTPGTNDDIVIFSWSEEGVPLADGQFVDVPLGLGPHTIELEVTDSAGETDNDFLEVDVNDTEEPNVVVTSPSVEGTCSMTAVTVEADATDTCDPDLDIAYECGPDCPDPSGGPTYSEPGNYEITVTATDEVGLVGSDVAIFSIDNVVPVVTIITPEPGLEIGDDIPIDIVFDAVDPDNVGGGIVHELITLDGCVVYDGNTYGDMDGLLQDDTLPLTEEELCRVAEQCGFTSLDGPILVVEATDDCGNTGSDFREFAGAVTLKPGICEPIAMAVSNPGETVTSWDTFSGVEYYDVVRGDVSNLGVTVEGDVGLGAVTCIEGTSTDTDTLGYEDMNVPQPSQAFFYLVRSFDGSVLSDYGRDSADRDRISAGGDCTAP